MIPEPLPKLNLSAPRCREASMQGKYLLLKFARYSPNRWTGSPIRWGMHSLFMSPQLQFGFKKISIIFYTSGKFGRSHLLCCLGLAVYLYGFALDASDLKPPKLLQDRD
jgi:hypothetical protein